MLYSSLVPAVRYKSSFALLIAGFSLPSGSHSAEELLSSEMQPAYNFLQV